MPYFPLLAHHRGLSRDKIPIGRKNGAERFDAEGNTATGDRPNKLMSENEDHMPSCSSFPIECKIGIKNPIGL